MDSQPCRQTEPHTPHYVAAWWLLVMQNMNEFVLSLYIKGRERKLQHKMSIFFDRQNGVEVSVHVVMRCCDAGNQETVNRCFILHDNNCKVSQLLLSRYIYAPYNIFNHKIICAQTFNVMAVILVRKHTVVYNMVNVNWTLVAECKQQSSSHRSDVLMCIMPSITLDLPNLTFLENFFVPKYWLWT